MPVGRRGPLFAVERPAGPHPAPEASRRSAFVWSESVALTAAFPLVGWWIDPGDPFFLRHTFPWIVFAPVLIGLRQGTPSGSTSFPLSRFSGCLRSLC